MNRSFLVAAIAAIAFSATIESAHASRVYLGASTAAYGSEIKGAAALVQLGAFRSAAAIAKAPSRA
jgi:hypothetical protein